MTADNRAETTNCLKVKRWANTVLCLAIFLVIGLGVKKLAEAPDVVALLNPEIRPSTRVVSLGDLLSLDGYHFELNRVTRQVSAEFSVSNGWTGSLRDIVVYCDLQDRSGEHRGSGRWVIYDTIAANSSYHGVVEDKRYISHLVNPDSITCRIVEAKPAGAMIASHGSTTNH